MSGEKLTKERPLSQKMETFCVKYFELGNATDAAMAAGYSKRTAYAIGAENLRKPKIISRLNELRSSVTSAAIMSVQERKERLSNIARGQITDYMEMGADGTWCNIGPDAKNPGAIQEIKSRTEYDDNGAHSTVHTSVKLHDPQKAIDLLNKMDKIYGEGAQVNIDNRKIEVYVQSEDGRDLVKSIEAGERTE